MGCSFWLFVHTLEAVFTSFYKSGYNQVTTTIILELSFLLQASSVHGSSHYILAHAGSHLIPGLDGTDSRSSFLLSSCQISILRLSELTPITRLIRKTSQSQLVNFPSHTEETSRRRGPSRPHQRGAERCCLSWAPHAGCVGPSNSIFYQNRDSSLSYPGLDVFRRMDRYV
ncbi:hypothetical protein FB446DRAFT_179748 [Lentinula raphanica]|nr:hypothetical protein FB446DRAFT_179748 [Lentinula raphanica]